MAKVQITKAEEAAGRRAIELIEYVLAERRAELAHSIVALGLREGDLDELAYALDHATTDRRIAIDAYLKDQSPRERVATTRKEAAEYMAGIGRG